MLSNPIYKENMKAISNGFKDQKELPLDRALWWIEWALRNPRSYVVNRAKNLNYFQIQSIDVISFLTVISLVLMYIVLLAMKKLFNCIFIMSSGNKSKKD